MVVTFCVVYSVFILDVIQTFLGTHAAWGFLISGWGDPGILTQPPWSVMTITLTSALSSLLDLTRLIFSLTGIFCGSLCNCPDVLCMENMVSEKNSACSWHLCVDRSGKYHI
jgi:hypothetical protein